MADFFREFFGLVFPGSQPTPKHSHPTFTPRIVGIPLQFHFFEPTYLFHADFLLAGETNNLETEQSELEVHRDQEPRKGGFSKGVFCRVQCHAQGNKKYPRILGPAVHLALRALQPREVYISAKTPFKNPLLLVPEETPSNPIHLVLLSLVFGMSLFLSISGVSLGLLHRFQHIWWFGKGRKIPGIFTSSLIIQQNTKEKRTGKMWG